MSLTAEQIRERSRERAAKWRQENPGAYAEKVRQQTVKRTAELEALAGRPKSATCELCGNEAKTVFDHDHAFDHFRGWLCSRCNVVLGHVKDSTVLLQEMINYLERTKHGATNRSGT